MKIKMILYTTPMNERRICFYNANRYSDSEVRSLIQSGNTNNQKDLLDMLFDSMAFLGEVVECIMNSSDIVEATPDDDDVKIHVDYSDDIYMN